MKIRRENNRRKHQMFLLLNAFGCVLVFGVWVYQIGNMFSNESMERFDENYARAQAEFNAGINYGSEIEKYAPDFSGSFEQVVGEIVQTLEDQAIEEAAMDAVAKEMIEGFGDENYTEESGETVRLPDAENIEISPEEPNLQPE